MIYFYIPSCSALGSPVVASTNPPTFGERKLFSNVTKLGFAAGHDSPGLKIEEVRSVHNTSVASDSSCVTGIWYSLVHIIYYQAVFLSLRPHACAIIS